jgi:hypothetical protein
MLTKKLSRPRAQKEYSIVDSCYDLASLTVGSTVIMPKKAVNDAFAKYTKAFSKKFKFLESERANNTRHDISVLSCISDMIGIKILKPEDMKSIYWCDGMGSACVIDKLIDGVRCENCVDGIISSAFIMWILPKFGASWHGHYGRDYNLMLMEIDLIKIIGNRIFFDDELWQEIFFSIPSGLRVTKNEYGLKVECLAWGKLSVLTDRSILITNDGALKYIIDDKIYGCYHNPTIVP